MVNLPRRVSDHNVGNEPPSFPEITIYWETEAPVGEDVQKVRDHLCRCGFWLVDMSPSVAARQTFRLRLARVGAKDIEMPALLLQLRKALKHFGGEQAVFIRESSFNAWKEQLQTLRCIGGSGTRSFVMRADDGTVLKIYHAAALDYMARELDVRVHAGHLPEVCPVVDSGERWFSMPYVVQGKTWRDEGWNLYPIDRARKVLRFIEALNAEGFSMVDWAPGCFLFDGQGGLHVVDFEYTHRTGARDKGLELCPDVLGHGHAVHIPGCRAVSYKTDWQPVVGLPLRGLLEWPAWRQGLWRAGYCLFRRWPRYMNRLPKLFLKRLKALVHGMRMSHVGEEWRMRL